MLERGASFRSLEAEAAPRSLREEAYDIIKQRIIRGLYRPGEALSEAVVSASLSLGRTPVRQAFDRLMRDGLVEVLPRKGIIVRPITADEIRDMVHVRLLNEGFCARLAAERADQAVLGVLNDTLDQSHKAARDSDIETLMVLDRRFHAALASAAGNAVLSDILSNLHDRSQRVWFLSLREHQHHARVVEEHAGIVAAISARDAEGAEAVMRAHILSFAENLSRQL